jgi:hypothetical protein
MVCTLALAWALTIKSVAADPNPRYPQAVSCFASEEECERGSIAALMTLRAVRNREVVMFSCDRKEPVTQ